MNSMQPCRSGSSRSNFKRSQSQNARTGSNRSEPIQKSGERLRKTKSLGDLKRSVTGHWNWQLETGSWSEVTLDQPIDLGIKRTPSGNQGKTAENYIINFIPASSSSGNSSFGKQSFIIKRNHRQLKPHILLHYWNMGLIWNRFFLPGRIDSSFDYIMRQIRASDCFKIFEIICEATSCSNDNI